MASAARRGRVGPKNTKMTIQGRVGPQRFHHCPEHDTKLKAVKTFGAGMHYECKEGCTLSKKETTLK